MRKNPACAKLYTTSAAPPTILNLFLLCPLHWELVVNALLLLSVLPDGKPQLGKETSYETCSICFHHPKSPARAVFACWGGHLHLVRSCNTCRGGAPAHLPSLRHRNREVSAVERERLESFWQRRL